MKIPKQTKTKETRLQGVTRRQDLRENLANFKKKKKEEDEEYQEPQLTKLDPGTVSKKVMKLIDELDTRFSAATMIMAFHYVAKNAQQNCYDINLPYWFDRYYNEIFMYTTDLIESSFVLEAVMSLFSRRVDNYYSHVSHRAMQNKDSIEPNTEAGEGPSTKEKEKKPAAPKGRQLTNKAIGKNDRLYEVDMVPKKFKTLAASKTTETLQSLNSLEAPKKYFENFNEYKEWRKMYKKKMKNPIPYSIVSEESYINPSMWKLSCIEDFDFDDDKHSKRNYSMFTNYIEHRYSTLVPDINFITHFKVKDFLEAEEDEIEMMKILGLPTPPSRTWPPFCQMSDGGGQRSIDETGRNQDYIQTYIALEDIVLSQEPGVENESNRTPLQNERDLRYENLRARINQTCSENDFTDEIAGFDDCHDNDDLIATVDETLKNIQEETGAPITDQIIQNPAEQPELNDKTNIEETPESIPKVDESITATKESNELVDVSESAKPSSEKDEATSAISANDEIGKSQSEEIVLNKTAESSSLTDSGYIEGNTSKISEDLSRVEENIEKEKDTKSVESNSQNEKVTVLSIEVIKPANDANEGTPEPKTTEISQKEPEVIQNEAIDDNDIDEGVWFSEIDEVTRAMFNPVVQLTDICKHVKENPEEVHFEVDEGLKNMFEIDEVYLRHEEEFRLPIDILVKEPQLELNIFGLPEKMLRKKTNFSLPNEDFEIYKKDRKRKQYNTAPSPSKVRLYKLNQNFFPNMDDTPRTSPDFLGFNESSNESCYDAFKTSDNILSSTLFGDLSDFPSFIEPPNKRPRLSDDSGIALTHSLSIPGSEDLETIPEENDKNGSIEDLRRDNSMPPETDPAANTLDKTVDTTKDLSHNLNDTDKEAPNNCSELRNESNDVTKEGCVAIEPNDDDDHFDRAGDFQEISDHQDNSTSKNRVLTSDLLGDISAGLDEAVIAGKLKDKLVSNNVTGRNEIAKQIQEWHRSLKPILARAHSRHHFDMYDLGTDILQTFDKVGSGVPGDKITLADVMEGRDPTHISRYFLTMLQMTNMQNIKLRANNPVFKKPTPLKNIELVLVSKKRQKIADEDNIGMIRNKKSPTNEEVSSESGQDDDDTFEDSHTFRRDTTEVNIYRGKSNEKILQKFKHGNREILSKEVNANHDNYMRKFTQKHGISMKLHDENEREQNIQMPACSSSIVGEKRQVVEFLYPGNMRSQKIQNAKRLKSNSDDLDSGVFSSTTELSLIPE